MTNPDRWNRISRRPGTNTINLSTSEGEQITRTVPTGGAYNPGLPLSVPSNGSRKIRDYRRNEARVTRQRSTQTAEHDATQRGAVTDPASLPRVGPMAGERRRQDSTEPPVTGREPGRTRRGAVTALTGQGTTGPEPRGNPAGASTEPPVTGREPGRFGRDQGQGGPTSGREPGRFGRDQGQGGPTSGRAATSGPERPATGSAVLAALEAIKNENAKRKCVECGGELPENARSDRILCGDRCKKRKSRRERAIKQTVNAARQAPGNQKYWEQK